MFVVSCGSQLPAQPVIDEEGFVDCASLADGPTLGPGEPGPLGFPELACNPRVSGLGEYRCCSDDPAAFAGELPTYGDNLPSGEPPYFSGLDNHRSRSGLCVRTSDVPSGVGLTENAALNCPTPCNPTWERADIEAVCGMNRQCCQTRELQPEDCVLDGDEWRPATGADIITGLSDWSPSRHRTHQDPGAEVCAEWSGSEDVNDPGYRDCLEQLSVADQRGYCLAVLEGCPGAAPDYMDACEQINAGLIPPPA